MSPCPSSWAAGSPRGLIQEWPAGPSPLCSPRIVRDAILGLTARWLRVNAELSGDRWVPGLCCQALEPSFIGLLLNTGHSVLQDIGFIPTSQGKKRVQGWTQAYPGPDPCREGPPWTRVEGRLQGGHSAQGLSTVSQTGYSPKASVVGGSGNCAGEEAQGPGGSAGDRAAGAHPPKGSPSLASGHSWPTGPFRDTLESEVLQSEARPWDDPPGLLTEKGHQDSSTCHLPGAQGLREGGTPR